MPRHQTERNLNNTLSQKMTQDEKGGGSGKKDDVIYEQPLIVFETFFFFILFYPSMTRVYRGPRAPKNNRQEREFNVRHPILNIIQRTLHKEGWGKEIDMLSFCCMGEAGGIIYFSILQSYSFFRMRELIYYNGLVIFA